MRKILMIGVAASALVATPAMAQQAGPWIGIVGGYDNVGVEAEDEDGSEDGLLYGVAAGYDFAVSGVLLGVEVEASDSTTETSATDVIVDDDEITFSMDRDLYVGARLGVPITEQLTGFVKAGYTNARIKSTYSFDDEVEIVTSTQGGYRVGGGLQYDFGKPFARLEYRYSNYGDFDDSGIDVDRHQVAATLGLRF